MLVYVNLLLAILGALVYYVTTNPKVARLAELVFFAGLLAFLFRFPDAAGVVVLRR